MKKTKVLLIVIAVLCVLIGIGVFILETAPVMDNFTGMTEEEVIAWMDDNGIDDYRIVHMNAEKTAGTVYGQSIKEGMCAKETVKIYVSDGPEKKKFTLPDTDGLTKETFEKWAEENGIDNISYIETENELDAGMIIWFSPEDELTEGEELTVYVSKEKDPEQEFKEDEHEAVMVNVPGTMLGYTEAEFIEFIKKSGLTAKKSEGYYSSSIDEGCIYSYEDGNFMEGTQISYSLSLGKFVFNENEFNGKTVSQLDDIEATYNSQNAHLTVYIGSKESSVEKGKSFDCSYSSSGVENSVKCMISTGKTESDSSDEDTSVKESAYIKEDKSEESSQKEEKSEEKQSVNETETITSFIPAMNVFESMVFSTASDAESFLKTSVLKSFTGVSYIVSSTKDYLAGSIYKVEVDGSESYEPGNYEISTPIAVYISGGF